MQQRHCCLRFRRKRRSCKYTLTHQSLLQVASRIKFLPDEADQNFGAITLQRKILLRRKSAPDVEAGRGRVSSVGQVVQVDHSKLLPTDQTGPHR